MTHGGSAAILQMYVSRLLLCCECVLHNSYGIAFCVQLNNDGTITRMHFQTHVPYRYFPDYGAYMFIQEMTHDQWGPGEVSAIAQERFEPNGQHQSVRAVISFPARYNMDF